MRPSVVRVAYQPWCSISTAKKPPTEPKDLFYELLLHIIAKVAVAYPHHALYQLLALKNGDNVSASQRHREEYVFLP
jgi:hypothetical protein